MQLDSSAFTNNQTIPRRFTGEGEDASPPLTWGGEPAGTKSFALVCEDPDAPNGTFHHWAAYDITPDHKALPEAFPADDAPDGVRQAVNDFGKHGYGGPMPPPGHGPHHYHFRLYALDTDHLPLKPEASVSDVAEAARAHKLAEATLTGTYERRK